MTVKQFPKRQGNPPASCPFCDHRFHSCTRCETCRAKDVDRRIEVCMPNPIEYWLYYEQAALKAERDEEATP